MLALKRNYAVVFLMLGVYVAQALAQPHISGILSGTLGPGTYIVDGDCQVLSGSTLTILPGTELKHNGHHTWMIYGSIIAEGTQNDSIIFTREQPYANYRWGGIRFTPTVPVQSNLVYCVIEHVYNGANVLGGAIYVEGNTMTVRNTRLSNCEVVEDGAGIYAYYGTMLLVEDCLIESCTADIGGGIYLNLSTGAQIRNCSILHNISDGT